MDGFDLVVRGGTLATAAEVFEADIGIRDGRIAALGHGLGRGREEISAKGMIVTPGGLDSHCHLEEMGQDGSLHEESFASGSAAALAGAPPPSSASCRSGRGTASPPPPPATRRAPPPPAPTTPSTRSSPTRRPR
ncbi:hypothetical protein [Teichococcus aestuarii]|uniref:hypothetical protein n=1 Tax=Teichococcus aestuarii TaxID=568898 RepID=UPI00360E3B9B